MKEKKLVDFSCPNHPKIENCSQVKDSLFAEIYKKAYYQINEICNEQSSEQNKEQEFFYNILPIIGNRGTGKTSVALSILKQLEHPEEITKVFTDISINDKSFAVLKHIDVGHLEDAEDLFCIVLARMLRYVKELSKDEDMYSVQPIYQLFSSLYANYSNLLYKNKDEFTGKSALTVLEECDAGHNIKDTFKKLVHDIVSFECNKKHDLSINNRVIVVTIDDIDVNISNAYKMLEQIQNYMMIPNLLIILTASYDNLFCICKKYYLNKFEDSNGNFEKSSEDLAKEYLNKIFPMAKMLYLNLENKYDFEMKKEFMERFPGELIKKNNSEESIVYTKAIFYKIAKATGIYFYYDISRKFFLEPNNLRSMVQYVNKINELEIPEINQSDNQIKSVDDYIKYYRIIRNNLSVLNDDIVKRYLSLLQFSNIDSLIELAQAPIEEYNYLLYCILKDMIHEKKQGSGNNRVYNSYVEMDYNDELNYIESINNRKITVSDLMYFIYKLNKDKTYDDLFKTVLTLFSVKLKLEQTNRYLADLQKMKPDDSLPDFNNKIKNNIDNEIINKYIGFSPYGMANDMMVNYTLPQINMPKDPDRKISKYKMGFVHLPNVDNVGSNNKIIEYGKINIKYVKALALFLLFLPENEYSLEVCNNSDVPEEEQSNSDVSPQLFMQINFTKASNFDLFAVFNHKNNEIISAFYEKVKDAVNKWNKKGQLKISTSELETLNKKNKDINNIFLEKECFSNMELMYNIGMKVMAKTSKTLLDAWKTFCTFFDNISEEFYNQSEYYSDIALENSIFSGKLNNITTSVTDKNDKESVFYLDKDESDYFTQIISNVFWS